MPAVPITSDEQYDKALEVLIRLGGSFQAVGFEERFLLVSPAQYQALVEANVVTRQDKQEEPKRGKNSRKTAKP
jgi:hypothetical protein